MVVWLAHESDESICKPSNLKEVTLCMVPVGVEKMVGLNDKVKV